MGCLQSKGQLRTDEPFAVGKLDSRSVGMDSISILSAARGISGTATREPSSIANSSRQPPISDRSGLLSPHSASARGPIAPHGLASPGLSSNRSVSSIPRSCCITNRDPFVDRAPTVKRDVVYELPSFVAVVPPSHGKAPENPEPGDSNTTAVAAVRPSPRTN
eukprot:RCo034821